MVIMAKAELPLAPIDRLVRKAGAGRVSAEAAETLRDILQGVAVDIGKVAVEFAKHAKRKTVVEDDVKLAYEQWKR
ncbi:MAG: histone family protein [Candidatus Heimdallarchaeota archaeon]